MIATEPCRPKIKTIPGNRWLDQQLGDSRSDHHGVDLKLTRGEDHAGQEQRRSGRGQSQRFNRRQHQLRHFDADSGQDHTQQRAHHDRF